MLPNLTDEMRQALTEHPDQPVYVVDALTQQSYVLVPAGAFQRLQTLLFDGTEPNVDEFWPLIHEALADDWNAPGMDAYDDYDRHRQAS